MRWEGNRESDNVEDRRDEGMAFASRISSGSRVTTTSRPARVAARTTFAKFPAS